MEIVASNIDKLLELQEKDVQIVQLGREVRQIPERKEQIARRLEQHRQGVEKAKEEHQQTQARIREYELEVETKKSLILKYRKQQLEIKDNEAYRALESEIRETERRIRDIEDSELMIMEKLEERQATVDAASKTLETEEALVAQDHQNLDGRLNEIQGRLDELKQARATLAEDIDPTWLSRYELVFKNKGDVALVNSVNGTCHGCHMKIQPQLVHDAKKDDTYTSCSYCGRMLYFRI